MSSLALSPETAKSIENDLLRLSWSKGGLTAIETKTGRLLFRNARCRVSDYAGRIFDLFSAPSLEVTSDTSGMVFRAASETLEVTLVCFFEEAALRISLEILNPSGENFALGDADILYFDRTAGAVSHLLANPCEVFSLGASTGETGEMWSKERGNMRVFGLRLHDGEPCYVTDNLLALRPVEPGELTREITLSFDRISEVACGFFLDLQEETSRARAAFRGALLPPGAARSLPILTVDGVASVDDALEAAASRVADIYQPPLKDHVAAGWCSWYYYYPHVAETDILENLRYLAAHRERFSCEYVQIDDGYQLHWGDWLLPGGKFPHDMAWLAREIKALGFKPGIWVAPMIMTAQSHLYAGHPDWALRHFGTGAAQTMKGWSPPEENPWVILDGTHPDFLAHLKRMFSVMAHEWGYEYFKLDATAFAACAGERFDPTKTGIEAVRMVMEAIREAVGPDKYILGCGVPFGAAVGLVNGERVSDDVSTQFQPRENCCPIAVAMPQSIHRSFIHGKWWHNDPDCVLVRSQGTPHNEYLSEKGMSLDEARFFVTVVGLTQGIQMVGENLLRLEEERLFLLDVIQPMMPEPARVLDLFSPQPERLLGETRFGRVLALLNWKDEPKMVALNHPGESCEVFELWTNRHLGTLDLTVLEIELPPRGSRVLFLRPPVSHPAFLGFDGHISAGGALLEAERWDPAAGTLSLDFSANRNGELSILVPAEWMPVDRELQHRTGRQWVLPVARGREFFRFSFVRKN